jgi:hypothetical protein
MEGRPLSPASAALSEDEGSLSIQFFPLNAIDHSDVPTGRKELRERDHQKFVAWDSHLHHNQLAMVIGKWYYDVHAGEDITPKIFKVESRPENLNTDEAINPGYAADRMHPNVFFSASSESCTLRRPILSKEQEQYIRILSPDKYECWPCRLLLTRKHMFEHVKANGHSERLKVVCQDINLARRQLIKLSIDSWKHVADKIKQEATQPRLDVPGATPICRLSQVPLSSSSTQ